MRREAPVWSGVVTHGRIEYDAALDRTRYLMGMDGQRVEERIVKRRAKRSHRQNNAYWGLVITPFAEFLGYEPDELHEALKAKFLTEGNPDDPIRRVRSTTDLNTAEMEDYQAQIRRLAASLGCDLPEPNEG